MGGKENATIVHSEVSERTDFLSLVVTGSSQDVHRTTVRMPFVCWAVLVYVDFKFSTTDRPFVFFFAASCYGKTSIGFSTFASECLRNYCTRYTFSTNLSILGQVVRTPLNMNRLCWSWRADSVPSLPLFQDERLCLCWSSFADSAPPPLFPSVSGNPTTAGRLLPRPRGRRRGVTCLRTGGGESG